MKFICALFLLLTPCMSWADDVAMERLGPGEFLPIVKGKVSATFIQPKSTPPVKAGATVAFVTLGGKNSRERYWPKGYVLGTREGIVLLEFSESNAIWFARMRDTKGLRLREVEPPDPEMIASRLKYKDDPHGVSLAPTWVTFDVDVSIAADVVQSLSPGAGVNIEAETDKVGAFFVSAQETTEGRFKVTLVSGKKTARKAMIWNEQGELGLVANGIPGFARQDKKCFVTRRSGGDSFSVQIPCTN